jgi:hypothetical protein
MEHLPAAALGLIVQLLPTTDRRRLAVTCRRFRQLCCLENRGLLLSQQVCVDARASLAQLVAKTSKLLCCTTQDLEDWADEALSAFPRAQRLVLSGVSLGPDCVLALQQTAPELLQGLTSLQVLHYRLLCQPCGRNGLRALVGGCLTTLAPVRRS